MCVHVYSFIVISIFIEYLLKSCIKKAMFVKKSSWICSRLNQGSDIAMSVLPKHTLFIYFILAKFKNYTLFILYFSQIL